MFSTCPTCKDYVDLHTHRCYIESEREVKHKREEANEPKRAAKRRAKAAEAAAAEDSDEPVDIAEEIMEADDFIAEPVAEPKKKEKNHRCMSGLIWKPVKKPVPMKLTSASTKPMKATNVCCMGKIV